LYCLGLYLLYKLSVFSFDHEKCKVKRKEQCTANRQIKTFRHRQPIISNPTSRNIVCKHAVCTRRRSFTNVNMSRQLSESSQNLMQHLFAPYTCTLVSLINRTSKHGRQSPILASLSVATQGDRLHCRQRIVLVCDFMALFLSVGLSISDCYDVFSQKTICPPSASLISEIVKCCCHHGSFRYALSCASQLKYFSTLSINKQKWS
jgi:hypothetical protein